MMENGTSGRPLFSDGLPAQFPLDETGRKRKKDRLVITGSPLGPQLLMLHTLEDEEADPNP